MICLSADEKPARPHTWMNALLACLFLLTEVSAAVEAHIITSRTLSALTRRTLQFLLRCSLRVNLPSQTPSRIVIVCLFITVVIYALFLFWTRSIFCFTVDVCVHAPSVERRDGFRNIRNSLFLFGVFIV